MKQLLLLFSLSIFLLVGCSSLDVTTDFDPEQDFSTYKTYAWFDGVMPEGDALSQNPLVKKRAISSVDKELASKGFTIADGDPDFVVIIHAGMKERMQVTNTGYGGYGYGGYGYGRYGGGWGGGGISDQHVSYYDEATVVVDIADFGNKELVWRGTGTGVLSKSEKTQEESQQTADEVIRRIMEDFPPNK